MPRNPKLRARFFVTTNAVAIPKAPPLTTLQRRAIYERDGGRCRYCGVAVSFRRPRPSILSDIRHAHVDHRIPRARGGQNDPGNLALACMHCNESKAAD